jgi:hypothetical protein
MQSKVAVKVREIIAGHFGIDPARVTDDARFQSEFTATLRDATLGDDWNAVCSGAFFR